MSAARITLCSAGRAGRRWVRGTRQRRGYSTPSGAQHCGNCGGSPIRTLNTSPTDSFCRVVCVVEFSVIVFRNKKNMNTGRRFRTRPFLHGTNVTLAGHSACRDAYSFDLLKVQPYVLGSGHVAAVPPVPRDPMLLKACFLSTKCCEPQNLIFYKGLGDLLSDLTDHG
jgi:hypothetical protein